MHKDAITTIDDISGITPTDGMCENRDAAYENPPGNIGGLEYIFGDVLGPDFALFPPLEMCISVIAKIDPANTGNLFTYYNNQLDPPNAGYLQITDSSVTLSMPGTTASFDTSHLNLTADEFQQIQVCTYASGSAILFIDCHQVGEAVSYLPQQYTLGSLDGIIVMGNPFTSDNFVVSFFLRAYNPCLRRQIAFVEAI